MNNQKQAEGSSQAEGHAEYVISMKKENKTLWEESYDKDFVGKLSINPNQHQAIKALIKIIISQERTQWERELQEKIKSLEATTWGNEVEYLAKDDVLALFTESK